jgi:hypothetical protein
LSRHFGNELALDLQIEIRHHLRKSLAYSNAEFGLRIAEFGEGSKIKGQGSNLKGPACSKVTAGKAA